jgi:DNA-binding NarL/FixJ family response regulator
MTATEMYVLIRYDYDYSEREKKVLELYEQGKSTRDIAKELRMSWF